MVEIKSSLKGWKVTHKTWKKRIQKQRQREAKILRQVIECIINGSSKN